MAGREPQPSDEELLRRAQSDDESARRDLTLRLERRLRARARKLIPQALRGKVAESDVVQETWIAAFVRLDEFEDRGDGSFRKWMATVLDRKVLDEVRRYAGTSKRDVAREIGAGSSVVRLAGRARDPSPSTQAIREEERARLAAARAALPEAHREVLRLVHDERRSFEDAGAHLGRTAEAARKLYGRAILGLADAMAGTRPPAG